MLVILNSVVVLGLLTQGAHSAATCDVKKFDAASADITFLAGKPVLPIDKEGFDALCPTLKASLQTAEDYVENCVTGLAKGMLKLYMEGAGKEINGKCTEGDADREEYFKVGGCLIPQAGQAIHLCNRNVAAIFEAAISKAKKDRIPLSCCYMGEYYECVRKASSACGKDAEAVTKKIIDNYAGDLMDSVCATWKPGSAKCKALPAIKAVSKPKYHTLVPPLADVLDSLNH